MPPPPMKVQFLQRLKELEDYKKQKGDCNIPNKFPQNQGLSNWARNQRHKFNSINGIGLKPTPQQFAEFNKLRELGFAWTLNTKAEKTQIYEETVDRVRDFKTEHPELWTTGTFNYDPSNLPEKFKDLTALCQDVQALRISKERKHVLKRLRVKLLNTESISALPAAMGDVVLKEGGEKCELENNVNSNKEVRFQKEIPNKLRRSKRSMRK